MTAPLGQTSDGCRVERRSSGGLAGLTPTRAEFALIAAMRIAYGGENATLAAYRELTNAERAVVGALRGVIREEIP